MDGEIKDDVKTASEIFIICTLTNIITTRSADEGRKEETISDRET